MKKRLMTIGIVLLNASLAVNAGPKPHYIEATAKVIDVEPIYEAIEINHPERHCWNKDVSFYELTQKTCSGTVLDGAIVHNLSQNQAQGYYTATTEQHCKIQNHTTYEEHVVGYHVKYRYQGHVFTTRSSGYPGKRIPIRIKIVPMNEI